MTNGCADDAGREVDGIRSRDEIGAGQRAGSSASIARLPTRSERLKTEVTIRPACGVTGWHHAFRTNHTHLRVLRVECGHIAVVR